MSVLTSRTQSHHKATHSKIANIQVADEKYHNILYNLKYLMTKTAIYGKLIPVIVFRRLEKISCTRSSNEK